MKERKMTLLASALLASVLLTSCAGSPIAYYSLDKGLRETTTDTTDATKTLAYLRAVRIPTLLQRPEIVTRNTESNQVNIVKDTLWAGNIEEEIAKQYARELEHAMPGLIAFNAPVLPDGDPDVFYTIEIDQLDGQRGGDVHLRMHWTAKYGGTNQTEQGTFKATERTNGNTIDDYVDAMNALITRSAQAMAAQLNAY